MIELIQVSKTFTSKKINVEAVKDANLKIEDGEIFGIIGFSGAGKSTLIRCINLLERPTKGQVIIDGKDLTKLSSQDLRATRKKIGMIFQHFNLMSSRTVSQNIALPLHNLNLSKNELNQKVASLLDLVGLNDKADTYPSQLSGGQKQRVAIARALANDPKILLCDEATSALDPQTTQSILKLLKEVNEKLGITIVLITHEMAVIKEICQRAAIMEEGYIKESNSILELFTNPKETVTKNFIATTSNLNKIYELIEEDSDITRLHENECLCILSYTTLSTSQSLISTISREFSVDCNIIFGNIEVIQDSPLGRLVVILSGTKEKRNESIQYLSNHDVKVEVIKP